MARTTTRRPARTFRVTRIESTNLTTGETFAVPGMIVTVAELRAMAACAPHTVNVWCEVCGESAADCPDMRGLADYPAGWSAFDTAEEES
jgi:hypothetical protein